MESSCGGSFLARRRYRQQMHPIAASAKLAEYSDSSGDLPSGMATDAGRCFVFAHIEIRFFRLRKYIPRLFGSQKGFQNRTFIYP